MRLSECLGGVARIPRPPLDVCGRDCWPTQTRTISAAKNGSAPLKVSHMGMSRAMELMTKTFMPTGGVIRPSDPIVEIVPKNSELLFEAKINPADIGYVRSGQKALLKLSTYDYSIYGVLEGYVDVVGSDSVEEQDGKTYYLVKLVPNGQMTSTGKILEMRSGMTAQIDIIAGKRSVLAYLSSPITKTLTSALPAYLPTSITRPTGCSSPR